MKRNLYLLYAFNFLKSLQLFGAIAVPFFLDWARIDYTRIFLLEATFVFFVFALEIPTGVIADRYGRKTSLALGSVFSAAAFMLFGLVNSYPVFFLADFLCAVGMTLYSGADRALLYDTLAYHGREGEAARHLSYYGAMETAGIVAGFPLGSLLAGSGVFSYPHGLPAVFIVSGITFLLSLPALAWISEPPRARPKGSPLREGIDGVLHIFRNTKLRSFVVNYSLISATTFFIFWFYQTLTRMAGFDVSVNGFVGAGFNLFATVLLLNAARIERLLPLSRLLFLTALMPGALYIGLFFTQAPLFSMPAAFVIVGLKLLRAPFLTDLMNRLIESGNRATVLSGVSMMERVVIMAFYPVVGYLADISISWTFLLLGLGTVLFAYLTRAEEKDLEREDGHPGEGRG